MQLERPAEWGRHHHRNSRASRRRGGKPAGRSVRIASLGVLQKAGGVVRAGAQYIHLPTPGIRAILLISVCPQPTRAAGALRQAGFSRIVVRNRPHLFRVPSGDMTASDFGPPSEPETASPVTEILLQARQ